MENNYQEITNILKSDINLSLEMWNQTIRYGIYNIRRIGLHEPNPHEGKVANPCSGLDQQFCHGPRHEKRGYEFSARNVNDGLDLVNQACLGNKDVKDTVSYQTSHRNWNTEADPDIHGDSEPQTGLDMWIFDDYRFKIKHHKDGGLVAQLKANDFHSGDLLISSIPVESVDEALATYEHNNFDKNIPRYILTGHVANTQLGSKLKLTPKNPLELAKEQGNGFSSKYSNLFEQFVNEGVNLSEEAASALFMGLLLDDLYNQPVKKDF